VFLTKRANERQSPSLSSAFILFFSVLLSAAFEYGDWEEFYEANDEIPLSREERCLCVPTCTIVQQHGTESVEDLLQHLIDGTISGNVTTLWACTTTRDRRDPDPQLDQEMGMD
jgi:hypothetical protein